MAPDFKDYTKHSGDLGILPEEVQDLIDNEQYDEAKELMLSLHHSDLASLLDHSGYRLQQKIIFTLDDDFNPETLVWLGASAMTTIVNTIGVTKAAKIISKLDIEDAIDVIEEFSENSKQEILSNLGQEKRKHILEGLKYPEDSVGRIIEKQFIVFAAHWNVEQAIDAIVRSEQNKDFHTAIVVNNQYKPIGTIATFALLKYHKSAKLEDMMDKDIKIAHPDTSLNDLSYMFKQYSLAIVPVVNNSGKLIGIISIDNMLYVVSEQVEEDIMHLAGVQKNDTFNTLLNTLKHRFPWLFLNLITACLTSTIIHQFSGTIAKLITLASVMPVVASMAGNAGSQALTVTVLALANKNIDSSNAMRLVLKELLTCVINGLLLALIGSSILLLIFSDIKLSIVFCTSVIINFAIAGFFGSIIPIIMEASKIDPAASSSVFLTAITDSCGFFIFLTLAYIFLI